MWRWSPSCISSVFVFFFFAVCMVTSSQFCSIDCCLHKKSTLSTCTGCPGKERKGMETHWPSPKCQAPQIDIIFLILIPAWGYHLTDYYVPAKCFHCISSLNPHKVLYVILWVSPCFRWGHWGLERGKGGTLTGGNRRNRLCLAPGHCSSLRGRTGLGVEHQALPEAIMSQRFHCRWVIKEILPGETSKGQSSRTGKWRKPGKCANSKSQP